MGRIYNYLVAVASAMGGFLFGYEIGVIDQVLIMDSFGLEFGLKYNHSVNGTLVKTPNSADISGWITFTFLVGCVVGAALTSILADRIGRRYSIFVGSVLFMIGGAMQTGASHIAVLYVGRIISGMGVGLMSAVVPLYISETAKTDVRGTLISTYQLMITFGILIASCINAAILSTLTGDVEWRLALGMQMVPAAILWGLIIILPFSPRWLVDRGREEEALQSLAKLRSAPADSEAVRTEFASIKESALHEKKIGSVTWLELCKAGIRNRVAIGVVLQCFQQWTGINVILYYAAELFKDMGFSSAHAGVTFVIANAAINFVATFPGMWLVERIGRKLLMIIGGFLMGGAHMLICLFLGLSHETPGLSWAAMVFVYVFTISFASTWGPVVWVYQSEIFPMRVRAKGTACCTMSNWIWNAIIAKITPIMLTSITFYTYIVFGSFGIIMAIFVWIFVPETKGKSLEDMDDIFGHVPGEPVDDIRQKSIRDSVIAMDSLKNKPVLH
ncbi:proton myo-inositol cotransporter-like [Paramacrobiotus metropolitanus]|uniref:proton myo-inositol cotransporter-like n=1 Tax=Paramacrobiotus metropolitanus TaxID=2943436 RepID=UPI002445F9D6|nr:proton myo-inositol cotransporter-like [Paramacrobiotus metropolitanus]